MTKDAHVEAPGEDELPLPDRLHRGLIANDRVKYYLTLLEAARQHAREPERPTTNLRAEREAAGLHDSALDSVVQRCGAASADDLSVPTAPTIMHGLFAELAVMLQPLRMAGEVVPNLGPTLAAYMVRLARLHADAPSGAADRLPAEAIDALTRVGNGSGDSVRQLTMDLHQELNRLRTLIADDVVDAHVSDESLVVAVWEHGLYVSALAERLRRAFIHDAGSPLDAARMAERAGGWHASADEIVRRWIRRCYRTGENRGLDLIRAAAAAADALEHAAFLVSLVPTDVARDTRPAFAELPELVGRSAKDYVRGLEYAARIERDRASSDTEPFLVAVDSVAILERHCRAAVRAAEARLLQDAPTRELHLLSRLVQAFASAADAIGRCALLLKDEVMDGRRLNAASA